MEPNRADRERPDAPEGFYRTIVEESSNPAWIYDPASLALLWTNAAAIAAYGYSAEELSSMTLADILLPEGATRLHRRPGEQPASGGFAPIARHRSKDGSIRHVETTEGAVVFRGRPARYAIVRDVTRLVRARVDAERRARRLEALHRIDRGIIEAASIREVARSALLHIREILPCERASLMLLDANGATARIYVLERDREASIAEDESFAIGPYRVILDTLRSEGIYARADLASDVELPPILAQLRDAGLRSIVSLALVGRGRLLGSLALYAKESGAFGEAEVEIVKEVADQLAIAITQAELREREHRLAAERAKLLSDLVRAQEEERKRIAGDLHDEVIQKLSALRMRLDIAVLRHPELVEDVQFERLRDVAGESIAALRTAMFRLRPPSLADDKLADTLRAYLAEEIGEDPIAYEVRETHAGRLPDATRDTLFRIAQEAIVNALRHARCSSIRAELLEATGGCLLRVTDDGRGWEIRGRPDSPAGHLGLTAMRERAESLGGWLRVDSTLGAGTTIECFAPLEAPG